MPMKIFPMDEQSSPSETSSSTCDDGPTDIDDDTCSEDMMPTPELPANSENNAIYMALERRMKLAEKETWHDYEKEPLGGWYYEPEEESKVGESSQDNSLEPPRVFFDDWSESLEAPRPRCLQFCVEAPRCHRPCKPG